MTIDSRFHDLGFGNKDIDLSTEPYDTNLLTYSNVGFGHKESFVVEENTYKNTRSLNFAYKKSILDKQRFSKVTFEDLVEKGIVDISKQNSKVFKIKNKLLTNPSLTLKVRKVSKKIDTNIYFNKISSKSFEVFNSSNRDIKVDYVANKTNKKLNLLNNLESASNDLNLLIDKSLIIQSHTVVRYDESTLEDKLIDPLNTSTGNYVSSITLDVNHTYVNGQFGATSATYSLQSLIRSNNSFFKFNTPQVLQDVIHFAERNTEIYLLQDPDDDSTRVLQELDPPINLNNYRISLESDTSYYVWFEAPAGAWYISTVRFPYETIYT